MIGGGQKYFFVNEDPPTDLYPQSFCFVSLLHLNIYFSLFYFCSVLIHTFDHTFDPQLNLIHSFVYI